MIGDGKKSIEALIDIVNSDPRRGIGYEKVLTRLELDNQAKPPAPPSTTPPALRTTEATT